MYLKLGVAENGIATFIFPYRHYLPHSALVAVQRQQMARSATYGDIPLGIGYYIVPEAARLLRIPARNIRRWLGGYGYRTPEGELREMPPLWSPQLPVLDRHIELGFRDLIELRFVSAFLEAGLGVATIRQCLNEAASLAMTARSPPAVSTPMERQYSTKWLSE